MRETPQLRVAYLGNFRFPHTTENEYRDAFERNEHIVVPVQEGEPDKLARLCDEIRAGDQYDFVLWTRTPALAEANGTALQWRLLMECDRKSIPTIGVHLDRWWGLEREHMIREDPYFRVNLLMTADGGHDDDWRDAGVNHRWLLPGVSERWCQPGSVVKQLECDVLFVGSWKRYHAAWPHRIEMVEHLSRAYGKRFHVAPKHGEPRVTMLTLNDYYWSAKVVMGDSCLVPRTDGSPMINYCSDRVPETLGRGGILLHPAVEGLPFLHDSWELGDHGAMLTQVKRLVKMSEIERTKQREAAIEHIRAEHTYTTRVGELVDILKEEKLL